MPMFSTYDLTMSPDQFALIEPAERLYLVLDVIDHDPASWNQGDWLRETECGTAACVAGHLALTAGYQPVWRLTESVGRIASDIRNGGRFAGSVSLRAAELLGFAGANGMELAAAGLCPDCEGDIYHYDTVTHDLFAGSNSREDLTRIAGYLFGERPAERKIEVA